MARDTASIRGRIDYSACVACIVLIPDTKFHVIILFIRPFFPDT